MSRQGPRVHRLPKRTDFKLIPAPLDLSLPLAEKSPLPAIIVTPSSPSHKLDFSIAFLADPPKPTIRQRLSLPTKVFSTGFNTNTTPKLNLNLRFRSVLVVFLVIFILICHLVTHNLAARHPHLELTVQTGTGSGEVHAITVEEGHAKWFDWGGVFAERDPAPVPVEVQEDVYARQAEWKGTDNVSVPGPGPQR